MRALIAAGGTAGHINPALAIADKIVNVLPESKVLFVGTPNGMESRLVKKAGYDFYGIKMAGIQRGLSFANIKRNVKAAYYYGAAFPQVKRLINEFRPDVCIGTGGYVCGAVLREAAKLGVKTATHESNSFPGITTKLLTKTADKVFLFSEDCLAHLKHTENCIITGNPLRNNVPIEEKHIARERLGLPEGFTILSLGGSLGANKISAAVAELMRWEQKKGGINHIHSYGGNGRDTFGGLLEENGVDKTSNRLILKEYIDNMYTCMCAADLIISRAGSMTLTEIMAIGRPAVLVPFPQATENHQYYNAKTLADANAALLREDKDLDGKWLIQTVSDLYTDRARLEIMGENARKMAKTNAADVILSEIIDLVGSEKCIVNSEK
ncbi:MAG: UDP-N-acetylglucosamine--N-acetylmuramyl-(pentapeptide) pyrophosphoryl-undecaprenol N-acetylglucosamine transferase [Oscillospiraceae bacterium]|nr:UDP-N-acetylglucosamine--N-acetylmuramyl-(pentapeptide) pyrophosphoryl-undecaprenol N-acetylglucosamine transferase [Oscillospiraceae bacterium]